MKYCRWLLACSIAITLSACPSGGDGSQGGDAEGDGESGRGADVGPGDDREGDAGRAGSAADRAGAGAAGDGDDDPASAGSRAAGAGGQGGGDDGAGTGDDGAGDDGDDPTDTDPPAGTTGDGCAAGPAGLDIVYSWEYQTVTWDDEGETKVTPVSGSFVFRADATYEQALYIGSILNYYVGAYEVCGDRLMLYPTNSEEPVHEWEFTTGEQDGRKVFVYQSDDPLLIYGLELLSCGDNVCAGEDGVCTNDCGSCDDGTCASGETQTSCPADCAP